MKFPAKALLIAALALQTLAAPSLSVAQPGGRGGYEHRAGEGGRGGGPAPAPARGYFARRPQPWARAPGPLYDRGVPYGYDAPPPGYGRSYYAPPPRYAQPPGMGGWRRGEFLPPAYRGYAIPDYARYHLRRPPRGYYWCRSGEDFVLVAAATGLIFEVINGED